MYPVLYVPAGDVVPIMFSTYAGATGASITLTGLAVTDVEIYKDGSVTQRSSDAGYTLLDTDGIDFDGITGIHGFSIDTGDNTDASFYTVGAWFTVVVSAVTVDSQTVNFIAAMFRIMPAESAAGVPKVDPSHFGGTAGTFASGRPEVNTTHAAGTAWGSGAITAAAIAADAFTAAKFASDVTTELQNGLATAAELAKVPKSDGTATWNATALAAIQQQAEDALAVYDPPTNTEMVARTLAAASYATAAAQATAQADLDTLTGSDGVTLATSQPNYAPATAAGLATAQSDLDTITGSDGVTLATTQGNYAPATAAALATAQGTIDKLDDTLEDDAGTFRFTTNALEQAPTGGSAPSAADIADAVWDEALAGHAGAGSAGEALSAAGTAGDPWTTALPGAYGSGTAGKIIGDNINATISSRATQTSVDTVDDLLDTEIGALTTELAKVPKSDGSSTWNATALASLQQEATDALNAYDPPTRAEATADKDELVADIAALNNLSAAQAETAAGAALATYDGPTKAELDAGLAAADDAVLAQVALVKAQTDKFANLPVLTAGGTGGQGYGAP